MPDTGCSKPKPLETDFTPHSLRHSTATYLTTIGVPARVIMEIMGHSSLSMTTNYQDIMKRDAGRRGGQVGIYLFISSGTLAARVSQSYS